MTTASPAAPGATTGRGLRIRVNGIHATPGEAATVHAQAGEPCPDGCTEGTGRAKRPVLVKRSHSDPAHPDYGELSCPSCWNYMGNDQRGANRW